MEKGIKFRVERFIGHLPPRVFIMWTEFGTSGREGRAAPGGDWLWSLWQWWDMKTLDWVKRKQGVHWQSKPFPR